LTALEAYNAELFGRISSAPLHLRSNPARRGKRKKVKCKRRE
jgi:hypothetical protein